MTKPVVYSVRFTDSYIQALRSIKRHGRSIIEEIQDKAEDLALFPEKKGKPLVKTLAGLWSRRVYQQRYRIIYQINEENLTVDVIYTGIRKAGSRDDVYEKTEKLKR